jgi:hypothetical protein
MPLLRENSPALKVALTEFMLVKLALYGDGACFENEKV